MFRKAFLCFSLLSLAQAIAAAQSFLLSPDYTRPIPTGPIAGVVNMSAARDAQGNLYVLANGLTSTCQPLGSPPVFCAPIPASYLVKLNPAADTVTYQFALKNLATAMTADAAGNVYLAGGNIVEKLGADGTTVVYKTIIGGPSVAAYAMAMDSAGRVYLTGTVAAGDLPATPGAFRQTVPDSGGYAGFAMRLKASGGIDYATYMGDAVNNPYGIAVDGSGSAFVIWTTLSADFPVTPGAYSTSGLSYLARLTPDGSGLIYSTFAGAGIASLVAADSSGHAVVALESAYGAGLTVTRFNPQGTAAIFSRNVPGVIPGGLAVDASGNTYFYDSVLPSAGNYPVKNSSSPCAPGAQQALTVFDEHGALVQSTYLPGGATPAAVNFAPGRAVDLFGAGAGGVLTHLAQNPSAQTVPLACIGNAASYQSGIVSPGEIVSLFGNGLGPAAGTQAQLDAAGKFPTRLANVQVTFDGIPVPLLYVQDSQINAIAPYSLQAGNSTKICVLFNGAPEECFVASVADAHLGVFMVDTRHAAALNQDGTLNWATNPAKVGSVVSIFATGLGAVGPLPPDGSIVRLPLPVDALPVSMSTVSPDGPPIPITVNYFGPAPFEVEGFSQINFTVDANVGGWYATFLYVGASGSQTRSNPFYIYVTQ